MPRGLRELAEIDQEVFRLYYVEGLGIDTLIPLLEWKGHRARTDDIVEAIGRIEETVDPRFLDRLADRRYAKSAGPKSARLLEFMLQARVSFELTATKTSPERLLAEKKKEETLSRIREMVSRLTEEEQRVLNLRFDHGKKAREISRELGLGGQRRVYTVFERALRKLRRMAVPESDLPANQIRHPDKQ